MIGAPTPRRFSDIGSAAFSCGLVSDPYKLSGAGVPQRRVPGLPWKPVRERRLDIAPNMVHVAAATTANVTDLGTVHPPQPLWAGAPPLTHHGVITIVPRPGGEGSTTKSCESIYTSPERVFSPRPS